MPNYNGQRLCGVEDTLGVGDMCRWPSLDVTWGIAADLPGFSRESFAAAIELAWSFWSSTCGVRPKFVNTQNANVMIGMQTIGPFGVLADCQLPCGVSMQASLRMRIDTAEPWVISENPPGDKVDLVRVIAHELGHGLGVPHIGGGNLMAPSYSSTLRRPAAGDIAEVVARYGLTGPLPPLPPVLPPPPAGGYTLTVSPLSASPGQSLAVTFTAPVNSSTSDWIGMYKVGMPHLIHGDWKSTQGATGGTMNFVAPQQPGNYEFRYLLNNQYTDLRATSQTVVVTGPVPPLPPPTDPTAGILTLGGVTYDVKKRT